MNIPTTIPFEKGYVLETTSGFHYLTLNSNFITSGEGLIFDNIDYFFDDIVVITGHNVPLYSGATEEFILEIELIKKWSLNHNLQHFRGIYLLEGTCTDHSDYTYPYESTVTVTLGAESDLLMDIPDFFANGAFKSFMLNNSFFIPTYQWDDYRDEYIASFRGGGEIKNDSLFLQFTAGGLNGAFKCYSKGTKSIICGDYKGKLAKMAMPCQPSDFPCKSGTVLWLKTTHKNDYILKNNSYWIWNDKIIIDGVEYLEGDDVEPKLRNRKFYYFCALISNA